MPQARGEAAMAVVGDNLYMFGGAAAAGGYLNDLWVLSESDVGASRGKPVWLQPNVIGPLPRTRAGQMVSAGTRLYIFGGQCPQL